MRHDDFWSCANYWRIFSEEIAATESSMPPQMWSLLRFAFYAGSNHVAHAVLTRRMSEATLPERMLQAYTREHDEVMVELAGQHREALARCVHLQRNQQDTELTVEVWAEIRSEERILLNEPPGTWGF